jgi:hypothetical protein
MTLARRRGFAVEMRSRRRGRRGGRGVAERLEAGPRPRPVGAAAEPDRCKGRPVDPVVVRAVDRAVKRGAERVVPVELVERGVRGVEALGRDVVDAPERDVVDAPERDVVEAPEREVVEAPERPVVERDVP